MSEAKVERLKERIHSQVGHLLGSALFTEWTEGQSLREGDLVVLNNSFLYREGLPTTKNSQYLCVAVDPHGQPSLPPMVTVTPGRVNALFKRVAARSAANYTQNDLTGAILQELDRQGIIVHSLVGRIGQDQAASVPIASVDDLKMLEFNPAQDAPATFRDETLSIRRLDDIDTAWSASNQALNEAGVDDQIIGKLANSFEDIFHSLQEEAGRPVDVTDLADDYQSILGQVVSRLDDQVALYESALEQHERAPDDAESYNELLRVAYNFADGTKSLMRLVVGVCDLKPLAFWLTIASQFDLAGRFADLPFSLVGHTKPSLERYRQLIAAARNRAFHDIFAFERSFVVALPPDALEEPELRLFRDHTRRKAPALEFEDRSLVDLLADFTRAPERPVPLGFWRENLNAMRGVAEVARALRAGLLLAGRS